MGVFPMRIRAVFENGKFVPQQECSLPEAAEVELTVESPQNVPTVISDPSEQARVMQELLARMKAAPLAADAPKLSRDQMHERR